MADDLKVIIEERENFELTEKHQRVVNNSCRLYLQPEWSRFEKVIPEIVEYVKNNKFMYID